MMPDDESENGPDVSSFLHVPVRADDKKQWVRRSQLEGLPLSEWVANTLNAAVNSAEKTK